MFRRDWRRWDTLRQLLQPWDLQLRKLRRMGNHDSRLLIQGAQRQMLIDLMDIVVIDRTCISVLVQR